MPTATTTPTTAEGATPNPGTGTQTVSTATFATWVIDSLNGIGGYNIPTTPGNILAIQTWIAAEGGPPTNPLNTSYNSFPIAANNATKFSSAGFPEYATANLGAEAVARTLIDGAQKYNYAPVIAALQQGASLKSFTQAVVNSSWDANHYAGTAFAAGTLQPNTSSSTSGAGDVGAANPTTLGSLGLGGLGTIIGDISSVTWWERVGLFVLGATVFVIGLVVFIATSKTGQQVRGEAAQAAPLAAVALA